MFIDPNIYNYESLTAVDQVYIDGYDKAIEELSEGTMELVIDQVRADYEDDDSVTGRLKRELIEAAVQTMYEILESTRLEIIAGLMDSYGEE